MDYELARKDDVLIKSGAFADVPRSEIDRLTVILKVYHEQEGEQPTSIEVRLSDVLETSEQIWYRQVKIGQDPYTFKGCWVEEPGLVVIENVPPHYEVNPTEQQQQKDTTKILRLNDFFIIKPNRFFAAEVPSLDNLKLTCEVETARTNIWVLPR
jgi:hypothetical protein